MCREILFGFCLCQFQYLVRPTLLQIHMFRPLISASILYSVYHPLYLPSFKATLPFRQGCTAKVLITTRPHVYRVSSTVVQNARINNGQCSIIYYLTHKIVVIVQARKTITRYVILTSIIKTQQEKQLMRTLFMDFATLDM